MYIKEIMNYVHVFILLSGVLLFFKWKNSNKCNYYSQKNFIEYKQPQPKDSIHAKCKTRW